MKRKPAQNSDRAEKRLRNLKPFKPGESGNPGGRPKEEREVVEAIRKRGSELIEALLFLSLKKRNVKAIEVALNRGYGKAKQVVQFEGGDGAPLKIDLNLLGIDEVRKLKELLERARPQQPAKP